MKHETCFCGGEERAAAGEPEARVKEEGESGGEGSGAGRGEGRGERESLRRENCHSYVYAAVFLCYHCFAEFPPSEEL